MLPKRREALLKIGALSIVGLFLLDKLVFTWAIESWKARSERIADLSEKVTRGRQLLERSKSLRGRWSEMLRTDLSDNPSLADNEVQKSLSKWSAASRASFSSLTPQWREHDDGYDSLEIRASANGDQASLSRLIYELETDPLPVKVSELEMSSRDAQGKQLSMNLRFSFVRVKETPATRKAAR